MKHRRFEQDASTPLFLPYSRKRDQVSVIYNKGEVHGDEVVESICFPGGQSDAGEICVSGSIIMAKEMSSKPFGDFLFDGVVGLGLTSLATAPRYSFLQMLAATSRNSAPQRVDPVFGLFLSDADEVPSELTFGGFNAERTLDAIHWLPVHQPQLGYWQVKIEGITVSGEPYEGCADGGCSAIIDSGSSAMGVPRTLINNFASKLTWPAKSAEVDCRGDAGPTLVFHLAGVDLVLDPKEYARAAPVQPRPPAGAGRIESGATPVDESDAFYCRMLVMPLTLDLPEASDRVFLIGEPALHKYYTAYQERIPRIGFALAAQPSSVAV